MSKDNSDCKSALRLVQAIPFTVAPLGKHHYSLLYFLPGVTKWLNKAQDIMWAVYHHGREREKLVYNATCFLRNFGDWTFGPLEARDLWWQVLRTAEIEVPKATLRQDRRGWDSQRFTHLFWWKVIFWFLHFYKLESASLFLVSFLLSLFFHLFNMYLLSAYYFPTLCKAIRIQIRKKKKTVSVLKEFSLWCAPSPPLY